MFYVQGTECEIFIVLLWFSKDNGCANLYCIFSAYVTNLYITGRLGRAIAISIHSSHNFTAKLSN